MPRTFQTRQVPGHAKKGYRHFNTLYADFTNYFSFGVGSAFAEAEQILQDVLLHIYFLICIKPAYSFVLKSVTYSTMVSAGVPWFCLNS